MPENYYNSRYSGEEIDAGVDAARQLLETSVLVTAQTLTDGQKSQARTNIAAAPSGYGLGGVPKLLTSADDINAWHGNGYYRWDSSSVPQNAPTLLRSDGNGMYMYEFGCTEGFTQICGCAVASSPGLIRRQVFYGVPLQFGEWEWVDPPLQSGVEYRTTERAAGKPVYAKRISYTIASTISTGTMSIPHGITSLERVVRCSGYSGDYPIPFFNAAGGYTCVQQITATDVKVAVYQTEWTTGFVFVLDLRYTKTTD